MNFASLRPRPDQERRQGQAKPLPVGMEFISPSSGREGRKPGELDRDSSITFTLHYGEVHSRHDRSASYRSARITLATLTKAKDFFVDCTSSPLNANREQSYIYLSVSDKSFLHEPALDRVH